MEKNVSFEEYKYLNKRVIDNSIGTRPVIHAQSTKQNR
jgi:hypothetical protein